MPKLEQPPDGVELISQAVHQWDEAKVKLSTALLVQGKRRQELAEADTLVREAEREATEREAHLRKLIAGGLCEHDHPEPKVQGPPPAPRPEPMSVEHWVPKMKPSFPGSPRRKT